LPNLINFRNVGLKNLALPVLLPDRLHGSLRSIRAANVINHHAGAVARQPLCDYLPNARTSTGDNRYFPVKTHILSPPLGCMTHRRFLIQK
jgi:hypothetical protein